MLVQRDYYLNKLIDRRENGRIKVITGIRRCGKSVLLFDLYTDYLKHSGVAEEQIIKLQLDTVMNARYRNPLELNQYVRNLVTDSHKQYYVLLDEIQEVRPIPNPWLKNSGDTINFVDVLLGLLDLKNVDLYVTGSNSKMLSSDIITEFKDRGDEIHVEPFMYKEFFNAWQGDARQAWMEYSTFGGLPRILSEKKDEDKSKYLHDLLHKTYLTDVLECNQLQNKIDVLDDLLNVVASSVGSLTNPSKIENTFASVKQRKITDATISTYLNYFEEAYLIRKAERYDIKGRKFISTPLKYYFTDIGLRNAQLNFRQLEETHIMENILFNELCARGFNVDVGIVVYNYKDDEGKSKRSKLEVDFVANKANKRFYIQSAFAIPNEEKRQQETHSLLRINDSYQKIVVEGNQIKPWNDENGIRYIGIEDFLLQEIDKL
ncbi:MAG: ATP-binding protein [Prevotella sp.]